VVLKGIHNADYKIINKSRSIYRLTFPVITAKKAKTKDKVLNSCCARFITSMSRSLYKGPYVDEKLLKKIAGKKPGEGGVIKTWARRSQISPEMVGFTFGVHNGKDHISVTVSEEMVGHRLGEFSPTKKFHRHGGKMQKELEQKKKEAEIAAAKAAKSAGGK
jgi:small subunit ribosomal protein S19